MKNIAILGSTGSIGTQTLQVIAANPDRFHAEILTAHNNIALLIEQARAFKPDIVVIGNEEKYQELSDALANEDIKVYAGADAIADVVTSSSIDTVVTATVGYSGLRPTVNAIKAGKSIALANKETLVVAGELVNALVEKHHTAILPVDSEHSAIFQSLVGEGDNEIEKIILTASGGPFRGRSRSELTHVKAADALKHPTWNMGAKITIDSASMMNKGFEVMEAKWLFGVEVEQIEVVVHPQSIVHSMVQFTDGCVKAQLGAPDMRMPIQYALTFPERTVSDFPRANFADTSLTFEKPDASTFRNLALAYEAMKRGGNTPCILNAANEIAVAAFLHDGIGFLQMSDVLEEAMNAVPFVKTPTLDDYIQTDSETRRITADILKKLQ